MYQQQTYMNEMPVETVLPEAVLPHTVGYNPLNMEVISLYVDNPYLMRTHRPWKGYRDSHGWSESTSEKERRIREDRKRREQKKKKPKKKRGR